MDPEHSKPLPELPDCTSTKKAVRVSRKHSFYYIPLPIKYQRTQNSVLKYLAALTWLHLLGVSNKHCFYNALCQLCHIGSIDSITAIHSSCTYTEYAASTIRTSVPLDTKEARLNQALFRISPAHLGRGIPQLSCVCGRPLKAAD